MKKRLLSFILAVSMMTTMVPATAFAEAEEPETAVVEVKDNQQEEALAVAAEMGGETREALEQEFPEAAEEETAEVPDEVFTETVPEISQEIPENESAEVSEEANTGDMLLDEEVPAEDLDLAGEANPFTIQALQLKKTPYHYGEKIQARLRLSGPIADATRVTVSFQGLSGYRQEMTYDVNSGYFIGEGYTLIPEEIAPGTYGVKEVCITLGGVNYYITDPKGERHGADDGSYDFSNVTFTIDTPSITNPYTIDWFRVNGDLLEYGDTLEYRVKLSGPVDAGTDVCLGIGAAKGIHCSYDSASGAFVGTADINNVDFPRFGMYTVHWMQILEADGDSFMIVNADENIGSGFAWNAAGSYDFSDYAFELDGERPQNSYSIQKIQRNASSYKGGDTMEIRVALGGSQGADTKVTLKITGGIALDCTYDSAAGNYVSRSVINNTWQEGTKQITAVEVTDPKGNRFSLGGEDYDLRGETFTVTDTVKKSPYDITSVTINRKQFRYRDSMELKVKVSGTVSGITDLVLTFLSGSQESHAVHCTYNSAKGLFLSEDSVDNLWRPGSYDLEMLTIVDTKGNRFDLTDSAMKVGGSKMTFQIIDEYVDPTKSYVVNFDGNGDTKGTMYDMICYMGIKDEIPFCDYSRSGYIFSGWNTKADGSGTKYSPYDTFTDLSAAPGKTVILYAQWSPRKYTLLYNGNGSTGGTMKAKTGCVYGTTYTLTANAYKRTGYTFQGWSTSPKGPVEYANKGKVKNLIEIEDSATLYAIWKPITYTVNFKGNGGKADGVTSYKQTMTYGVEDQLRSNTFTRPGYTFLGWNLSSKAKTPTWENETKKIFNLTAKQGATVSLNAIWKANTYTIHFDANGGVGTMADMPMVYAEKKALPANVFTREGYRFGGWECDNGKTYGNKAKVSNLSADVNGHTVLKVKWLANTYTVTFKLNGGKAPNTTTFAKQTGLNLENKALVIPDADPFAGNPNYKFLGWNTEADGSGKRYQPGTYNFTALKNKQAFTLYAESEYTLVFHGGECDDPKLAEQSVTLKYGQVRALTDMDLKRTGYRLLGWNTDSAKAAAGRVQYSIGTKVKNLGGKELYAVWKKR